MASFPGLPPHARNVTRQKLLSSGKAWSETRGVDAWRCGTCVVRMRTIGRKTLVSGRTVVYTVVLGPVLKEAARQLTPNHAWNLPSTRRDCR